MDKIAFEKNNKRLKGILILLGVALFVFFEGEEPVSKPKVTDPSEVKEQAPGTTERLRLYPDGSLSRREFVKDGKLFGRQEYYAKKKLIKTVYYDPSIEGHEVTITYDQNQKPATVENCPATPFNEEQKLMCAASSPEITAE